MLKLMAQCDDDTVITVRQIQDTDTYEYGITRLSTGIYKAYTYSDKAHVVNMFIGHIWHGAGLKLPLIHFS